MDDDEFIESLNKTIDELSISLKISDKKFTELKTEWYSAIRERNMFQAKQEKTYRKKEIQRVNYKLMTLDNTYATISSFAKEYAASKEWWQLCQGRWKPVLKPRKYQPGDIVFDVNNDKKAYIFVGAMNAPGSTAWWVISPEGLLTQLHNIQYANDKRGSIISNPNSDFYRAMAQAIREGS